MPIFEKLPATGRAAGIVRDAQISECGRYRWTLSRHWSDRPGPIVAWVMLNPSTADAHEDDATLRRCIRFSRDWGYAGLMVVNLFAYRATDPAELALQAEPVGPRCDTWIATVVRKADLVVAAWGAHAGVRRRATTVLGLLRVAKPVHALAFTKDGHPRHPLRLPANLTPQLWLPRAA